MTPQQRTGGFVTVSSPISFHNVRRQCEKLLNNKARVIVFDIQLGRSDFEDSLKLSNYIVSLQGAQTVAFVSKPLSGHSVMVALAADELVMAPKATIGDIGQDEKSVTELMRASYADLARRKRPGSEALVLGMLHKDLEVWELRTAAGKEFATGDDIEKIDRVRKIIGKEVVIPKGQLGSFDGNRARTLGLAKLLAETTAEVAERYGLSLRDTARAARDDVDWQPVRIRVAGDIDTLNEEYVIRHVKESLERGKNFFIFEIASSAGSPEAAMKLADYIAGLPHSVFTVAYIPKEATGAAAFIPFGCDEIIMHRDAKLGECDRLFQPGGEFSGLSDKELEAKRDSLTGLAQKKGFPPALVAALIDKDVIVKEARDSDTGLTLFLSEAEFDAKVKELADKGRGKLEFRRVVKDRGELLTLDGQAAEGFDLAQRVVENFEDLIENYGLQDKNVLIVTPNWVDSLISWLNYGPVSWMILFVGIACLWVEVKLTGAMLPGILAALCFLLFFWSHFMGGTATALEIVMFLAGVLCLAIELLVIPGFGVFGVVGVILMVASIVLASQTFVFPHSTSEYRQMTLNIGSLVSGFVAVIMFAFYLGKYLPEMPLFNRMVLKPELGGPPQDEDAQYGFATALFDHLRNAEGVALTTLRPAGRARFGDEFVDVVSEGDYIDAGCRVRVIEVSGNRVVVKQA